MSWWTYVERIKGSDTQDAVAAAIGVKGSTVSRWRTGGADPKHVAAFARHYKRPVLEAFVEAGFLTEVEAKQRPAAAPSLDSLSDDELLDAIRERLRRAAVQGGHRAVPAVARAARTTRRAPAGSQLSEEEQRAAELGASVVAESLRERKRRALQTDERDADEHDIG